MYGALGRIQTCSLLIRSQKLYSIELRVRVDGTGTGNRTPIVRVRGGPPAVRGYRRERVLDVHCLSKRHDACVKVAEEERFELSVALRLLHISNVVH